MKQDIDALKKLFREGRHADAIAQCEALCLKQPANNEVKRLCANMHVMVRNFRRALELLHQVRDPAHEDADLLFNIGMCERELQNFQGAQQYFGIYTEKFPGDAAGWVARGDALESLGKLPEAVDNYKAALALNPADDATLKKTTTLMLEQNQGEQAIALCNGILKDNPQNLTARLGAQWILGQLVPLWHVPMMNEPERNQAFQDGLETLVTPDKLVFEIGAGSGLLAMMAARLGAKKVVTCEAVGLVATTARKIVERNGYQEQVTVLSKPSQEVQIGADLPAKADILLHEIFSSELLGEHVLPAIEDAKARLLKPGGAVLPAAASIMIALVGGDAIGKNLHIGQSFGFDLSDFNTIHPKKRPMYREDLAPTLMSDDIEAFRFNFARDSVFPAEAKKINITVREAGLCYGLIQWIRIDMTPGVQFQNHPARPRAVSNWQHTVYGFDAPVELKEGAVISVSASHDRSRPWFELAAG